MAWIDTLKVGDKVIVDHGGWPSTSHLRTVTRLTKTQIILNNDAKYNRKTGHKVGTGIYYSSSLREATPEALKEMQQLRALTKAKRELWDFAEKINRMSVHEIHRDEALSSKLQQITDSIREGSES